MTEQPAPLPRTTDVLLRSMDAMFAQLVTRLDGLTADEYLWEPVANMWSVRDVDGMATVEGAGVRDVDPAPMTTIAWRLWHITIDCFDDYSRRFDGDISDASAVWTLEPAEAIERLHRAWQIYRTIIDSRPWSDPLGPFWGPWSTACVADMAMHASNELVHHAAEIALLRDLYRAER